LDEAHARGQELADELEALIRAKEGHSVEELRKCQQTGRALASRRDQLQNENAQLKREIKSLRRKLGEEP
jgi:hypothetical protein